MSDRIRMDAAEIAAPEPEPKPKPPPPPEPKQPDEAPKPDPVPPRREAAPAREAEPPAESTDADAEDKPEADETEADKARKERDRTERRIKDAQRRRYEAERDRDLIRQQYEQLQAQLRANQPPQPGQPPVDAVEEAKRQLRAEADLRTFNEACNKVFNAGVGEYGDTEFRDAVASLNAVGAGARPDFLQAVTEIPDGHKLYPLLAADLDNAARILGMPAARMAVELAKLAMAAPSNGHAEAEPEPAPVTQAPAPIRTIRGGSARQPNPATETMAEFIKRRDREDAEKRRI